MGVLRVDLEVGVLAKAARRRIEVVAQHVERIGLPQAVGSGGVCARRKW
jgi:hypothetical protein